MPRAGRDSTRAPKGIAPKSSVQKTAVSRRFYFATLLTLPAAALILLVRSDHAATVRTTGTATASGESRRAPSLGLALRAESALKANEGAVPAPGHAPAAAGGALVAGDDLASALRRADVEAARELSMRTQTDPARLRDANLKDALLAVASDPTATQAGRAVALDLIRRAPGIDEAAIAKIQAIVAATALDADTRSRAIDLLHQLTANRPDLEKPIQAALIDAAAHAPDDDARTLALETLSTKDASQDDVARVTAWLADGNPRVRAGAARALATSALRDRTLVTQELERALGSETDADAASVLIESALRAGRGSADALLSRMEQTSVVRASAALARQINDYRGSLGAGETDPLRILSEHEAREGALVRSSTKGS